ncbi:unnamed protein product [Schistocephalus solidus]|uniref:C2H2-type domain-containing protein n=1 Tax=Schistocephalus solidus TaxID=70667 RepID=A0A183T4V8_SCHSO|nr:unnamed protein product [Schistocephalus solidus]
MNSITPTILETTSQYSSPVTPTTATAAAVTTTTSDGDSLLSCPHCDRKFTTHIGLVSHLRIHRTEPGELVLVAPTHNRDRRLHCPHCPHAFTHPMGLFGHIRIQDSGIHHNADKTETPCTPSAHFACESVWSDIFELDATKFPHYQPLPHLPQTTRRRPPQPLIATSSIPRRPRSPTPSSLLHPLRRSRRRTPLVTLPQPQ